MRPSSVGLQNGALAPCPATPNCVSTQAAAAAQRMAPIPFAGTPAEALARVRGVIDALPRTRVAAEGDGYLHVEFTTALLRFVDDVEFLVDPAARVIHFRSASRVGRSDLGTNRRRMEEIVRLLTEP